MAALVLAALGLGLSLYLARLHARAHAGFSSFCDVNEIVNCDRVATSEYSVVLGIPVAVWGVLGYGAAAVLAAWGLARRLPRAGWPRGLLLLVSVAAAAASVVLALVSEFAIGAWCLVCMGSWLVSFGMLAASWFACRRVGGPGGAVRADLAALSERAGVSVAAALLGVAALAALAWAYPRYWSHHPSQRPGAAPVAGEKRQAPTSPSPMPAPSRVELPAPSPAQVASPAQGTPGPAKRPSARQGAGRPPASAKREPGPKEAPAPPAAPRITIVEYSDYECPYCALAREETRALQAARSDITIVHRQYPLDASCNTALKKTMHPDACNWARAGICGQEQGRSVAMDDALFRNQKERLPVETLAARIGLDLDRFRGCLSSPETERRLAEDIAAARRQGVSGTPTYVVGDQVYLGRLPESLLAPGPRSALQP